MVWVGPMATSKLLGLPIPTSKKNATDGLLLLDQHILGGGGGQWYHDIYPPKFKYTFVLYQSGITRIIFSLPEGYMIHISLPLEIIDQSESLIYFIPAIHT